MDWGQVPVTLLADRPRRRRLMLAGQAIARATLWVSRIFLGFSRERTVPLSPGMTVSVEVMTGERRIIEYVTSPLVKRAAESARER